MNKLSKKNQLLVGVALFSMFFGAGNLIFPSFLGYQAGTSSLPAFIGLSISAVGLPMLGVAAVSRAGSLQSLAGRVSKPFASIYTILIYLSIGPLLAIPRNGSTSFEMAISPLLSEGYSTQIPQLIYSVLFFGIALFLALRPNRLIDLLGKRMSPILLLFIAILFISGVFAGFNGSNQPSESYIHFPSIEGFLNGYQTMDAIVSIIFGVMLSMNIRERGITEEKALSRTIIHSGFIAGTVFLIVYGALTWLGAKGTQGMSAENGAQVLTYVSNNLFGRGGQIILGIIFVIACLNTCITLICCCAQYFNELWPLSYKLWAVIFAIFSAIVSNFGLNTILQVSVPILNSIYPMAIVLISLAFLPKGFEKSRALVYPLAVGFAGIVSVLSVLNDLGINIPVLTSSIKLLPLASYGLGWLLPAIIGAVLGIIIPSHSKAK